MAAWWLTSLAPAINVIAGSRYPYWRFLLFDLLGEVLWVLFYGGLGYLFAGQWQQVSQLISAFSGLSVALLILGVTAYYLILRRKQAVRQLRKYTSLYMHILAAQLYKSSGNRLYKK